MVDIGSMMQKLEKSEKAREEIEQKLMLQDAKMGTFWIALYVLNCKLHSVSVVPRDNDLAQFEHCYREAQSHFILRTIVL